MRQSKTPFLYNKESPPDSAANTYFIAFESKVDKDDIKSHGGETIKQLITCSCYCSN